MINPLRPIGSAFLAFLATAGRLTLFLVNAVSHCVRPPFYGRQLSRQLIEIGFFTLPVVGLTAIFAGMVLALQSYTGFARFSAEGAIANVVVLSITRELGPVLAGLMIAGRIGAAMAAEIGTMRVTEQVDALTTLSTNPMKYLVAPRLIAGTMMLPFVVLIADVIGVFGGYSGVLYTNWASTLRTTFRIRGSSCNHPRYRFRLGQRLLLFGFITTLDGLLSRLSFRRWAHRASARRRPMPWCQHPS